MSTVPHAATRSKFSNTSNDLPLSIQEMAKWLVEITSGEVVNIDGVVNHIVNGRAKPITSTAVLFAAIDRYADVAWSRSPQARTKEEFSAGLTMYLTEYAWASEHPHFPRIEGVLYTRKFPAAKRTGAIDNLIGLLNPASALDARLLKSLVLTLYWGGPPGRRPMFTLTGDGCGSGKSAVVDTLASLVGGAVSIGSEVLASTDDRTTTRLLSQEGRAKRIAVFDNLKTQRFSSARIEGMVTAQTISGYVLRVGEGSRPNYVTWMVTINGASFSKDFAERNVIIKVQRPQYSGTWESTVAKFVKDNRTAIEADARYLLEVAKSYPITAYTRRGVWEHQVLAKFKAPNKTIAELAKRGLDIDADSYEREGLLAFLRGRLKHRGVGKPDDVIGTISASLLETWLKEYDDAITHKNAHGYVSRHLHGSLKYERTASSRHWIWRGQNAPQSQQSSAFSFS